MNDNPMKNMDCTDIRAMLSGLLDDQVAAETRYLAERHLAVLEEIAQHLSVPVGTVMSRLNRARIALMEEVKRDLRHATDDPLVFDIRKYREA